MAVEDFLGSISRDGLCNIASRLNNDLLCISDPVSCVPTFGTFNVIIPLLFETGEKWIARIPRPGRMFSQPNPELLEQLMLHAGRVVTRDILIDRIWGPNYFGDTKTLDVHISELRKKLESQGQTPPK